MPIPRVSIPVRILVVLCLSGSVVRAQQPSAEDQAIDAMRALPQIGDSDKRRMQEWLDIQIDKVAASPKEKRQAVSNEFRKSLKAQFDNAADTPAFRSQLRASLAQAAVTRFGDEKLDRWVGFALARVMVDYNAIENVPGFLAGLKCREELVRYLAAEGLAGLNASLPGDKEKFDQVVAALRDAGQVESSGVVVARIYAALAYPAQIPAVFEAFMSIFDKRLAARRAAAGSSDGGEIEAFEFFRTPAVLTALSPEQKNKLVGQVAVFLRMDAERYDKPGLSFDELDRLERRLDGAESILAEVVGAGKGGAIRDELGAGGHAGSAKVRAEAYKWVGSKDAKGVLNDAPLSVPAGAP